MLYDAGLPYWILVTTASLTFVGCAVMYHCNKGSQWWFYGGVWSVLLILYGITFHTEFTVPQVPANAKFMYGKVERYAYDGRVSKIDFKVEGFVNQKGKFSTIDKEIGVKCEVADVDNLSEGTMLLLPCRLKRIGACNEGEFDYQRYCYHQGYYYTQYLDSISFNSIIDYKPSYIDKTASVRRLIADYLQYSKFSSSAAQFLIAISIGDKKYLDEDVRESFAKVGIAHILALSGFHLGILATILLILLLPLDLLGLRSWRIYLVLLMLLFYCYLVGFPSSLVRAWVMMVCVSGAIILSRRNALPNSLALAALIILLFSPHQLFNVGFQLSFVAVFSIYVGVRMFPCHSYNKVVRYLHSLFVASLSAAVATSIIAAYYFHNLPLLFLIPNMVILPMLPFIVSLALLAIVTNWTPLFTIFNGIYYCIMESVKWLAKLPFACISDVYLEWWEVVLLLLVITLGCLAWYKRSSKLFTATIATSLLLIVLTIVRPVEGHTDKLIVLNDKYNAYVMLVEDGKATMLSSMTDARRDALKKYHAAALSHFAVDDIVYDKEKHNRQIEKFGKTIVVINRTPSKKENPKTRIKVDVLILNKGADRMEQIEKKYEYTTLVLTPDKHSDLHQHIINTHPKQIVFDVTTQGAFILK